ncbi:MAG: phosphate-starvation-inducible PsiE family protein [Desulfurivibrionaceae bacterium]|nr:phosphate-starvation-inducible PsiE family protein [Desulfobulbales bacterium]MDT8335025.1 phosphate-starvation-inducible PsiE family protein [Desulfurivibrionaceae bacterium]
MEGDKKLEKKSYFLNVRFLRQLLIGVDDLMHFVVALVLAVCGALILVQILPNLLHPDVKTLLHVLNDVLLVLIVMELMWPIIRFLKRESFTLNPFLYIGIISCIRRILLIEAEHSIVTQAADYRAKWETLGPVLAEMGANVFIILILAVSLRILAGRPDRANGA